MSSCALQFASKFIIDIGAEGILLHVPQLINSYTTFRNNLPRRSPDTILQDLEKCTTTTITNSMETIIGNIIVKIVAMLIISLAVIIGIGLAITSPINRRLSTFLIIILLLVWVGSLYILFRGLIPKINIDGCVSNAAREIDVYETKTIRAINSGLCAY